MTLKPFVLNTTDLEFLLAQINFLPLFDFAGNAIIAWNGTGAVYDSSGAVIWDPAIVTPQSYKGTPLVGGAGPGNNLLLVLGASYQTATDLAGLRDVSGLNNNLALINSSYGAVDQIFTRSAAADYANYSPIMQAIAANAYAAAKVYYGKYSDGSATDGTPTGTFNINGTLNTDYTVSLGGAQTATDGTAITIKNVVDYTPRMISLTTTTAGVTYDTWANHSADPLAVNHTANEIYYDAQGVASVLDWGQLKTVADGGLGQVDTQARLLASAGQNDHFIGGLNPGVSPSNGFFVLFGQFFDHGLDFIDKSSGATIKIALATDDPLYGMIGADGQPVHEITINRATVQTVDAKGAEYINHTSPFIDQSQTYGSHAQLTNLLREWVPDTTTAAVGDYHAGMKLFDGTTLANAWQKSDGTMTNETLPTLSELRQHVASTGRDALTWEDVLNLRNRDASGHVSTGDSGSALILDMNPRFDLSRLNPDDGKVATTWDSDVTTKVNGAIDTLSAYVAGLNISGLTFGWNAAHSTIELVVPAGVPGTPAGSYTGASALGLFVNFSNFTIQGAMGPLPDPVHAAVGEVLMASVGDHYIAGDGRVNENFGLTAVHHIFHEEHNSQVDNLINALHREAISTGSTANLNSFQVDVGTGKNAAGDFINADGSISWDQDKIFNGAKLVVEMEYQHAAVDQYARNVTPNIQEFVGYSPDKNPAITLEYAQSAFRFGHSTLRETIDTIDPSGGLTGKIMGYALKDAFLSPEKYANIGPASVLLGMSHQQMNEVDEFVTPALNQGLLGQPLDLAAINIARGRDLGIPTLNDFRAAIGLVRYTSWTDFGQNMQHPSSLVNFIAAYSFDGNLAKAQAVLDLVDGTAAASVLDAAALLLGWGPLATATAQAFAFLEGGDLAFNKIDTWLGGIAEIHQPGGLLGETFDKVFVNQIESLMDGDRFYYLFRLAGQQFAEEVGNGQLKDIVERNTGLEHLNGNIFGYADKYYDFGAQKEVSILGAETQTTSNNHKYGDAYGTDGVLISAGALTLNPTLGIYSNGGRSSALDGSIVNVGGVNYIRDTRLLDNGADTGANLLNGGVNLDGTPNSGAESSEVIVASTRNDLIYAQGGDDTVYGENGDDVIFGGYGIDRLYGGDGKDTIYGGDNPDLIDGGSGDDLLHGDSSGSDINGADQVIGGSGNDTIYGDVGIDKLSGGTGDDAIYGGQDTDPFTHGSDGNDLVVGGSGGDILYGDNGDDVLVGGADQDQLFGGNGDDILRPGDLTGALTIGTDEVLGGDGVTDEGNKPGTLGFDLIDFSDNALRPGAVTFDLGGQLNPSVTVNGAPTQVQSFQIEGAVGSAGNDSLTGSSAGDAGNTAHPELDVGENWIIGGSGSDVMAGLGGNDIIVGGSIRLDALIGKYNSGYTHNNANAGFTAAEQLEDARYQGASNRVLYSEAIDNSGLIDAANALGGTQFDKHFTELLRSKQFKDTVLGDGGADAASTDTVVFSGNRADYDIKVFSANGITGYKIAGARGAGVADGADIVIAVETFKFADVTLSQAQLLNFAPEIKSDGGGATAIITIAENMAVVTTVTATDANNVLGDPLNPQLLTFSIAGGADALKFAINATTGALTFVAAPNFELPADVGANNVYDVIVQVSDGVAVDTQALAVTVSNVDEAATGALHIGYALNTNGAGQTTSATLTATSTVADGDLVTAANPTGAVTGFQWQRLVGATWTNIAAATGAALANQTNTTVRVTQNYTDVGGAKQVVSDETAFITGGNNNNNLVGTLGADIMLGLGGNDTLAGGAGNDTLDGGTGNDRAVFADAVTAATFSLSGGSLQVTTATGGTDTLISIETARFNNSAPTYALRIGTDADNTFTANNSPELFLGFGGTDTVAYTGTNGVNANLATGVASNGDRYYAIENLTGAAGNDALTGDANVNVLRGGGAADILTGGGGNDLLFGDAGTDTAVFTGAAGTYQFSFDALGNLVVADQTAGRDGTDTLASIERLTFASSNYTLLAGTSGNNTMTATNARELMVGGAGNDTFVFNSTLAAGNLANRDLVGDFVQGQDSINLSGIDANTGTAVSDAFLWDGATANNVDGTHARGHLGFHYDTVNNLTIIEGNTNSNAPGENFQIALRGQIALTALDFTL